MRKSENGRWMLDLIELEVNLVRLQLATGSAGENDDCDTEIAELEISEKTDLFLSACFGGQ